MKQGWELKTLGDVCQFQNGFAFKSKTFKDEGVPVLRISNIQKDNIDLRRIVFVDPSDYKEDLSKYVVNKGDLLIAMSGATTGKIGFNNTDDVFYLNQRVGKFKPLEQLNIHYLYYFLSTQVEESLKISAGSAQPNLSTQQVKSFKLPIPPVEEQKQIVAKLDQCFEAIDKARANTAKNLENTKELFQSKLNDIFSQKGEGWVKKKLGDAYDVRDGTHDSPKYQDNGFPLITSKNLKNGLITLDKIKYISEDDYLSINKRSKVDVGDILFAMIGTIGNPVVIRDNPGFSIKNVALFKVSKNNDSDFLRYYLEYSTRVMKDEAKGTTQKFVGLGYLRNFTIPLPDLDVQKKVVYQLNRLNKQTQSLESKYQQELNSLEELKKSILQKAFEGEL